MQTTDEAARATMQHLDTGARDAILGRHPLRSDTERTLTFAGLMADGTLTELGQICRDGWTCERCDEWHPATEEHYSDSDCNTTGRGVSLCKGCVRPTTRKRDRDFPGVSFRVDERKPAR